MTADMAGNESTRARPAFGPRMKAAFDMAWASVPSCERIVTLSADREATTVALPQLLYRSRRPDARRHSVTWGRCRRSVRQWLLLWRSFELVEVMPEALEKVYGRGKPTKAVLAHRSPQELPDADWFVSL